MAEARQPAFFWPLTRHALFLVLLVFYLRYGVDPRVFFEAYPSFPSLYVNAPFLREFLTWPGGPAAGLTAFLSLSYASAWGGPLVLTALVGVLGWCADRLVVRLADGRGRALALVPGLLLLGAFGLVFGEMAVLVTLLLGVLGFVVYEALAAWSEGCRVGLFLAMGGVLYYVGGGAFLLFGLSVGLYELLLRRARLPALVALLSVEGIPYLVGTLAMGVTLGDAFLRGLPWHPETRVRPQALISALYACFPALVVASAARQAWATRLADDQKRGETRSRIRRHAFRSSPLVGSAFLLLVASVVAVVAWDGTVHRLVRLQHAAARKDWPQILRTARKLPPRAYIDVVSQTVNRALFETGRLGEDLFRYPQTPASLLVDMNLGTTIDEQNRLLQRRCDAWLWLGDLDLQLGLINEAEHEAHEALAQHGPHPAVLEQLALANLVKGRPEAAGVFLNALWYHPLYRRSAGHLLTRMAADPSLRDDPQVQRLRSVALTRDRIFCRHAFELRCEALLESNPQNRMALEYLMACYLLQSDLDAGITLLPRFRAAGYSSLPRRYQELVLVYEVREGRQVDRAGYDIAPEVLQSFADFRRTASTLGLSPQALAPQFGDTFFFYHTFGTTGAALKP